MADVMLDNDWSHDCGAADATSVPSDSLLGAPPRWSAGERDDPGRAKIRRQSWCCSVVWDTSEGNWCWRLERTLARRHSHYYNIDVEDNGERENDAHGGGVDQPPASPQSAGEDEQWKPKFY